MAQMPTTLNSMTHFALTEEQTDLMDGEPGEFRDALRKTAVVLAVGLNRLQAAIDAGLIGVIDNTLPEPETTPDEDAMWVISDGYDPPKYWQDSNQTWTDDVNGASHYNNDGKDAETLPSEPPTATWVQV